MNWKDSLKPNLFKISFIIAVFLVFGIPYTYQISVNKPIGHDVAKERGLPSIAALTLEYGPYSNPYYGFRPIWSWNFSYETAPPKYKFSFNIIYFIVMSLFLYLLSCLIFAVYGTIDKNSNSAGRFYSRIGIALLALIVVAWILFTKLRFQLFGFEYLRATVIMILATWTISLFMLICGIIGYKKQDKLASIIVILISIIVALYGYLGSVVLRVTALL